jgi:hypothetical protein
MKVQPKTLPSNFSTGTSNPATTTGKTGNSKGPDKMSSSADGSNKGCFDVLCETLQSICQWLMGCFCSCFQTKSKNEDPIDSEASNKAVQVFYDRYLNPASFKKSSNKEFLKEFHNKIPPEFQEAFFAKLAKKLNFTFYELEHLLNTGQPIPTYTSARAKSNFDNGNLYEDNSRVNICESPEVIQCFEEIFSEISQKESKASYNKAVQAFYDRYFDWELTSYEGNPSDKVFREEFNALPKEIKEKFFAHLAKKLNHSHPLSTGENHTAKTAETFFQDSNILLCTNSPLWDGILPRCFEEILAE